MISYYNGKVSVYLHEGIGFKSCPMHVINIFIIFVVLFIFIKSDTLYVFNVVYEIHYDNVYNYERIKHVTQHSTCDPPT